MQIALETLGYPTYHMTSNVRNVLDVDMWQEAFAAKFLHTSGAPVLDQTFWDQLLGHVSATTDLPCAAFFEELIAAYPRVKCVLVEREVEAWYKSWHDVQIANYCSRAFRLVACLNPSFIGRLWTIMHLSVGVYVRGENRRELEARSRAAYVTHNKAVRKKVPKEQLLIYRLGSGWEPLCAFLGKDVPQVPFPRVNETEMINEYVNVLLRIGLMGALQKWAGVVGILGIAIVVWWWFG